LLAKGCCRKCPDGWVAITYGYDPIVVFIIDEKVVVTDKQKIVQCQCLGKNNFRIR